MNRPNAACRKVIAAIALLAAGALASSATAESVRFEMLAASDESYAEPHDIVLSPDGKLLYVADNRNNRIAVLDAESLREIGTFANGEVSAPHDVVFDAAGRLLVADTGNARIAVYEVDAAKGRLVGSLEGNFRGPEGVGIHPDGRVFVTGAWSNNMVVFRDGRPVGEMGGLSSPHDVEFSPSGAIWIADAAADRMVRVDDNLAIVTVLDGKTYGFHGPRYMDFDAEGRMFVADKYSNRIRVINPQGEMIAVLGTEDAGMGENVFDRPEGVEIRGDEIWFADTYNDRIVRYRFRIER
ncbi:MAG: NHL repeat-containing protein [Gammaproteobacteria bacterium]|nr:NHL repeat-containing protein [Gammaproteobacteria bacterium]